MLINNCFYFSEMIQVDIRLIKRSILTIQKYIHQEAKKYNKNSIYALQKKILLKKEIILFVLFKILKMIKKKIFFPLYTTRSFMQIIKLRLSHDILLLLLQPKWLVKLERCFFIKKSKQYIAIISQHISKILIKSNDYKKISKIIINPFLDLKTIRLEKWLKKVDDNTSIVRWLYNYLIQQKYIKNTKILIDNLLSLTTNLGLSELFKIIYFTGLEWFLYTNRIDRIIYRKLYIVYQEPNLIIISKKVFINKILQDIGRFIKLQFFNLKKLYCKIYQYSISCLNLYSITVKKTTTSDFVVKPNKQSIKSIMSKIKRNVYCKNEDGYWRVRTDRPVEEVTLFIESLLKSWYNYYFNTLDILDILKLNKIIDDLLYSWQIKKHT
uniref:Putative group II intron reverse transcriptase/maturase protein n=1 Tax=Porolithon onkodes TaxID=231751 RepID=A0A2Z2L1A8_9FLOR|nr:putative group II intron reverse transcriptase/maturase protein [Porolithon onkodes]ASB29774.1 putative group II intron reverse transcriptase/maturase protein [Porolithon onkodes]